MRLGRWLLGLAGLGSACAGFNVGSEDGCASACATAHACGFLPSGLGFGVDGVAAIADCERRCRKSPREAGDIDTILSCLDSSWQAPDEVTAWCTDPEAGALAGDVGCATASLCLLSEFPGGRLEGDVHIEVSLISFADFSEAFGAEALAELYEPLEAPVTSCAPALCGPEECTADDEAERPCDTTLCGRERVKTGTICSELGAAVIELGVDGRYGPPITQVLLDDDDEVTECKEASKSFTADMYEVRPGPAHAFARVSGRLPASELARIGVAAVDDEEGAADFCGAFPGMTATLRAGHNLLLVPIGTIDDLEAAGLTPTGCKF